MSLVQLCGLSHLSSVPACLFLLDLCEDVSVGPFLCALQLLENRNNR